MPVYPSRYKILAPAAVDKVASDPKKAAEAILESTGLDPDQYRLGHTKACYPPAIERDPHPIHEAYIISPLDSSNLSDRARYVQRVLPSVTANKIWPIGKVRNFERSLLKYSIKFIRYDAMLLRSASQNLTSLWPKLAIKIQLEKLIRVI